MNFAGDLILLKISMGILIGLGVTHILHYVVYALPLNRGWSAQTLHCPNCKSQFTGLARLPFIGVILNLGRCSDCGEYLPVNYVILDIISPVVIFWVIVTFNTYTAVEIILAFGALTAIAFIDNEHWIIPNKLITVVFIAGLLEAARHWDRAWFQLSGALPMLALLGLIALIQVFYSKEPGLGMGDLKLVVVIGTWLGPLLSIYAMFFATLLSLLLWLIMGFGRGFKIKRAIQFGPFIALSAMIFGIGRAIDPQLATHLLIYRI